MNRQDIARQATCMSWGCQTRRILEETESEPSTRHHAATEEARDWGMTGKPRPRGDTQINRNELIIK